MAYTRRRYGTRTRRRTYRRMYRRSGRSRYSRTSVFKRRSELSGTDLTRQTFHTRMVQILTIPGGT